MGDTFFGEIWHPSWLWINLQILQFVKCARCSKCTQSKFWAAQKWLLTSSLQFIAVLCNFFTVLCSSFYCCAKCLAVQWQTLTQVNGGENVEGRRGEGGAGRLHHQHSLLLFLPHPLSLNMQCSHSLSLSSQCLKNPQHPKSKHSTTNMLTQNVNWFLVAVITCAKA